jgi:hypothetical protein
LQPSHSAKLSIVGFALVLSLAAFRAYQYPEYNSDEFQYMANAVAMHGAHAPEIHETVYRDVLAHVPPNILPHLLGKDLVQTAQSRSYQERASNPYRFTEFLPCFAIRPIFNELVYILHYGLGVGLLRATSVIGVLSFWCIGWLAFFWVSKYVGSLWAAILCSILVLTPPIWDLGRWTTPDGLSTFVVLLGLYVTLEKESIAPGLTILLAAVYVRTDNVLLVLLVLAYLTVLKGKIDKPKAVILGAVAIGSVLLINHFAGDYGAKMLYYRAFVTVPSAPGEVVPYFGWHDYLNALRSGTAFVLHEHFVAFGLMGLVGFALRPKEAIGVLAALAVLYSVAHFVLYPEPEERLFGIFFVATGISLAPALAGRASFRSASQQLSSTPVSA